MSDKGDFYSGFFLSQFLGTTDGKFLIKVACFKAGTDFRKVMFLTTKERCDFKYGEIIHFRPIDGFLQNETNIVIKKDPEDVFIHEIEIQDGIVHTAKEVDVTAEDLLSLMIYRHPIFGDMISSKTIMTPGIYGFNLIDNNTFELEIVGAASVRDSTKNTPASAWDTTKDKDKDVKKSAVSAKNTATGKTENAGNYIVGASKGMAHNAKKKLERAASTVGYVIEYVNEPVEPKRAERADEIKHNNHEETIKWRAVGNLKLIGYNDRVILSGLRPVFELCDETRLMVFKKQRDAAAVMIIKQIEEKKGKWEDDPSFEPQEATLLAVRTENRCIALLKSKHRPLFEHIFHLNDIFRFKPAVTTNLKDPDNVELQEVLRKHSTDPAELQQIEDGKTVRDGLNPAQHLAVKMALNERRKVVCLQGGPGTGKTHALAMLLCKLIRNNKQVIVLTPTKETLNTIKAMTEKTLLKRKISYPENGMMEIEHFNNLVNGSMQARGGIVMMKMWRRDFEDNKINKEILDERTCYYIRRAEVKAEEMMKDVRVIFSTISFSSIQSVMENENFKPCMCIIDEASQVSESQKFPSSLAMKKIVIAGDMHGLQHIALTEKTKNLSLRHSVLDQIIANKKSYSWIMFVEQYRCHKDIFAWSNTCLYESDLKTNTADRTYLDCFEPRPPKCFLKLYEPFVLVDTSAQTNALVMSETYEHIVLDENGDFSFANRGEAYISIEHYEKLRSYGVNAENIAMITPYTAQVALLQKEMTDYIEMGIASNLRLLNVAVTRAKRHFLFIGNAHLLIENRGEIRKIYEFLTKDGRRFHPNNVSLEQGEVRAGVVRNNFGRHLSAFIEYSNDIEMIEWCENKVRNK